MEKFAQWFSHPFNEDQSVWGWVGFVGLIVVAIMLWAVILGDMKRLFI